MLTISTLMAGFGERLEHAQSHARVAADADAFDGKNGHLGFVFFLAAEFLRKILEHLARFFDRGRAER